MTAWVARWRGWRTAEARPVPHRADDCASLHGSFIRRYEGRDYAAGIRRTWGLMNGAHLHLIVTHLPVLGTGFGTLLLGLGLIRRSRVIQQLALSVLVLAGVTAGAAYLTGEGAEGGGGIGRSGRRGNRWRHGARRPCEWPERAAPFQGVSCSESGHRRGGERDSRVGGESRWPNWASRDSERPGGATRRRG